MTISTPVAFLIFNRPKLTKIVFEAIRQAKPQKLLVVADGPRFPEEVEKCQRTQEIINQIDWECEVLTNFSQTNLGCKQRVSSGLNWIFSEVEEAIILEDDCLPAPSFFYYCQTLLEYYRHDERIMAICGENYYQSETTYSYRFSKYSHMWGWASWRRAWNYYDVDMKTWTEYMNKNFIASACEDPWEQKYWTNTFNSVFKGEVNTWDYQWIYNCFSQNGLSIVPNTNLISNIGYGLDATHTLNETHCSNLPTNDIWSVEHPLFIVRDKVADNYTFNYRFDDDNKSRSTKIHRQISNIASKVKSWVATL